MSAYVPPEETGHRGRGRRQTRGGRGYLRFCQLRFATIPDAASIACADSKLGIWAKTADPDPVMRASHPKALRC